MRRVIWFGVSVSAALFGLSASADGAACASMKSLRLENTTITKAEALQGGTLTPPYGDSLGDLPAFCRVEGVLRPSADSDIRFEVWMPSSGWNGRFLGVGNGGYAGRINYPQMASSLRRGFATASTDTGHQAESEDASWAFHHPEKIRDFGYRALHLTALRAKEAIAAFYDRPANRAYFDSCSTGGRQGLMEAQRFPGDYDGVLAGAPANHWTHMMSSAIDVVQTMMDDPAAYISTLKLPAIHRAALEACDALDGVKDGIISDPNRCHFDPAVMLCKGEDALTCLTAPQVKTARKLYAGGSERNGKKIFPGYAPGSEVPSWEYWVTGAGPGAGAGARYPVNYFRYMVINNPKWEILDADAGKALAAAERITGGELNAVNPDLEAFTKRGGKMILYHGWDDAAISPWNTISYFQSVGKKIGGQATGEALRLYMVPGMGHCTGGPGPDSFGQLGLAAAEGEGPGALNALTEWVEKGKAPGSIVAAKFEGKGKAAKVVMRRPLCAYPQVAKYKGSGDVDLAENFACGAE